jgi:hypothetical protein
VMDYGVRARCVSLQYRCGKDWIIAMATGPPRASELVYGVDEVVAKLDAEVGVQGCTEATSRLAALARPGRVRARSLRA